MFIEVTDKDYGDSALVNVDNIAGITLDHNQAVVIHTEGLEITVEESYQEIKELLKEKGYYIGKLQDAGRTFIRAT